MKKIYLCIVLLASFEAIAQVGVGTPLPNASAQLEIVSQNRGLLIPRLPLTSSTDATTIANGNVVSLMVYNTATVANDITPGYYYWDGARWNRMGAGIKTGTGAPVALNPANPQPGDVYVDQNTGNLYTYNGTTNSWVNQSQGGVSADAENVLSLGTDNLPYYRSTTFSGAGDPATNPNPPANPQGGDIYIDENTGNVYTYNGTTNAWVSHVAATEPWFGTDDNMGATSNTEEIYSMGKVGIGTTTPFSVARLDVQETNNVIGINTLNKGAGRVKGVQAFINSDMTANGALRNSAAHLESNPGIAAGVTNSAYDGGVYTGMLRGLNPLDQGTLANGYGIWAQYGHFNGGNASMVTTEVYGLHLENYAQTGSIGTMYDLYIEDNVTPGIATNHWSIYNSSAAASYINGNLGIGTTTPSEKLEINGKIKATSINFTGLPTFADDASAGTGGLVAGDMYKTATGELRIKL